MNPRHIRGCNGVEIVLARTDGRARVAAITIAVPVAHLPREQGLIAPLIAALWAADIRRKARREGRPVVVDMLNTCDVVGFTAEALTEDRETLRAIPNFFVSAGLPQADDEFKRARQQALGRLRAASTPADHVRRLIFGETHRYGYQPSEFAARISRCTPETVDATVRRLKQTPPIVASSFDDCWGSTAAQEVFEAIPYQRFPTRSPIGGLGPVNLSPNVGAGRALVLLGTPGVSLGASTKYAVHALWSMMRGREGPLDRVLRGEHALTYSIGAFSREFAEGGYGVCILECSPAAADQVTECLLEALEACANGLIADADLDITKERLVARSALAGQSARATTERLVNQRAGQTSITVDYATAIRAVSPDQVANAARAVLGRAHTITLGTANRLPGPASPRPEHATDARCAPQTGP